MFFICISKIKITRIFVFDFKVSVQNLFRQQIKRVSISLRIDFLAALISFVTAQQIKIIGKNTEGCQKALKKHVESMERPVHIVWYRFVENHLNFILFFIFLKFEITKF